MATFDPARLKRWKFGAKSEAMTAQQRALLEETMADDDDEASLQALFGPRGTLIAGFRAK